MIDLIQAVKKLQRYEVREMVGYFQADARLFGNLEWISEKDCDIEEFLITKINIKTLYILGYEGK